jgi:hypothetical protein
MVRTSRPRSLSANAAVRPFTVIWGTRLMAPISSSVRPSVNDFVRRVAARVLVFAKGSTAMDDDAPHALTSTLAIC